MTADILALSDRARRRRVVVRVPASDGDEGEIRCFARSRSSHWPHGHRSPDGERKNHGERMNSGGESPKGQRNVGLHLADSRFCCHSEATLPSLRTCLQPPNHRMSLIRIAWRSIQQRGLASLLTAVSMALGVMLVVAVLLILGVVTESFRNNSSLGYNMIVGAKGGALQLVLNSVYYLSQPVENVPYVFYQEFVGAEERSDGQDGKFKPLVEFAIPLCLGDYFQGFRVVGTSPRMFADYVYDKEKGKKYEFQSGRNFKTYSPEYGYFEAVLGAQVARQAQLKVGDAFSPTHGPEGDSHDAFFVVGILKPSGTPNDRAAFVNIEGFLLLEGHAKPAEDVAESAAAASVAFLPGPDSYSDEELDRVSRLEPARRRLKPLPVPEREVTSILIRTVSGLVTMGLRNTVNEGQQAQAVLPIAEIYSLFQNIVGPIQAVLLVITVLICVVSGVSILVSIYNSMSDRRHEIAVMRALGAGRTKILIVVLLESVMLALGGGFLGWFSGHLLIGGLASRIIEERTGVTIGFFDFAPPVKLFELLGESPIIDWGVSSELLLIPGLILLAIVVGFLPALAAYRTDVAKALST